MTATQIPVPAGPTAPAPTFVKPGRGGGVPPTPPPPGAPRPPAHPPAPRAFALISTALALFAALFLAEKPAGIGLALLGVALTATTLTLRARRDRFSTACLLAAGILAAVPAVRDSGWVASFSVLGALTLASIALADARTWREMAVGAVMWIGQTFPAPFLLFTDATRRASGKRLNKAGPALRGSLLAAGLVMVFGGLFASADAHFADVIKDLTSWDLSAQTLVVRATIFAVVLTLAGALWLVSATSRPRPAREASTKLGRTEWFIALTALTVLFAAFVLMQLPELFGGDDRIQHTAGLTYATNARQGFVQLIIVAGLTLALVMSSARYGPAGDWLIRVLNGILCLLTIVVVASALHRLGLYQDAYGATRLRFSVDALMLWLGAVLLLIVLAGAIGRTRHVPRGIVALSAVFAIGAVAVNPDARIASRNVDRYLLTGHLDSGYLTSLSGDAVPALRPLPSALRSCIAAVYTRELGPSDPVASANVGRIRARHTLTDLRPSIYPDAYYGCTPLK